MESDSEILTLCFDFNQKNSEQSKNFFESTLGNINKEKYEIIIISILNSSKNHYPFSEDTIKPLLISYTNKRFISNNDSKIYIYVKKEFSRKYSSDIRIFNKSISDTFLSTGIKDNEGNFYLYSLVNFDENDKGDRLKNLLNFSFEGEYNLRRYPIKFYAIGGKFQKSPEINYFENIITKLMLNSESDYKSFSEGLFSKQRDYYPNNGSDHSIEKIGVKGKPIGKISEITHNNFYDGSKNNNYRILFIKNNIFQSSDYFSKDNFVCSEFIINKREIEKFDLFHYPGYIFEYMKNNSKYEINGQLLSDFYANLNKIFLNAPPLSKDLIIDLKEVLKYRNFIEYLVSMYNQMNKIETELINDLETVRNSVYKSKENPEYSQYVYNKINEWTQYRGGVEYCDIKKSIEKIIEDIKYHKKLHFIEENNTQENTDKIEGNYEIVTETNNDYIEEAQIEYDKEKIIEFENRRNEDPRLKPFFKIITLKKDDFESNLKILKEFISEMNTKKEQFENVKKEMNLEKDLEYQKYIISYLNSEIEKINKQISKYESILEDMDARQKSLIGNIENKNSIYAKNIIELDTKIKEINGKIEQLISENNGLNILLGNNSLANKQILNKKEEINGLIEKLTQSNKLNIKNREKSEQALIGAYKIKISNHVEFEDEMNNLFFNFLFDNCDNKQKINNMLFLLSLFDLENYEEIRSINYGNMENFFETVKEKFSKIIEKMENAPKEEKIGTSYIGSWWNYLLGGDSKSDNSALIEKFNNNLEGVTLEILFDSINKMETLEDVNYCEFKDIYFYSPDKYLCIDKNLVNCYNKEVKSVIKITPEIIKDFFPKIVKKGYILNTYIFNSSEDSSILERNGDKISRNEKRYSFDNSIEIIIFSLINPKFRIFFRDIPNINRNKIFKDEDENDNPIIEKLFKDLIVKE